MHSRNRSGLAAAMAIASLLLAAPVALAAPPEAVPGADKRPDQAVNPQAERTESEAAKPEHAAQKSEAAKPEKAEKAEKADDKGGKRERLVRDKRCAERSFARVFKPWHDRALYTAAPAGDFESLAEGWTLEGAALAADSSPFQLGAALGASSLELPAGATALSPPICVERGFPTFRLVARSMSTERAVVRVEVVFADGRTKKTGRLKPGADWHVTRKLSLAQGRFKVHRGESALVQLRFAGLAGTARLDDVYVDPRFSR